MQSQGRATHSNKQPDHPTLSVHCRGLARAVGGGECVAPTASSDFATTVGNAGEAGMTLTTRKPSHKCSAGSEWVHQKVSLHPYP